MATKKYELPLSVNYVRHWGIVEAVRELLQNALDSDSPFEFQHGKGFVRIISRGSYLPTETLVLGETTKADDNKKIGSFGEGYKIALLVLVRAGISVEVFNNDKYWVPSLESSKQFNGTQVLVIKEKPYNPGSNPGLIFHLSGLSDQQIADVSRSCIRLWQPEEVGVVEPTPWGDVLLNHSGTLFVNGLFVCNTRLKYSYNMKPQYLRLERDRQTVSTFDLQWLTMQMWNHIAAKHPMTLCNMVDGKALDVEYIDSAASELVKGIYHSHFQSTNGQKVAVEDQLNYDAVAAYATPVLVPGTAVRLLAATSAYTAALPTPTPQPTPRQVLEAWFDAKGLPIGGAEEELFSLADNWRLK